MQQEQKQAGRLGGLTSFMHAILMAANAHTTLKFLHEHVELGSQVSRMGQASSISFQLQVIVTHRPFRTWPRNISTGEPSAQPSLVRVEACLQLILASTDSTSERASRMCASSTQAPPIASAAMQVKVLPTAGKHTFLS